MGDYNNGEKFQQIKFSTMPIFYCTKRLPYLVPYFPKFSFPPVVRQKLPDLARLR